MNQLNWWYYMMFDTLRMVAIILVVSCFVLVVGIPLMQIVIKMWKDPEKTFMQRVRRAYKAFKA